MPYSFQCDFCPNTIHETRKKTMNKNLKTFVACAAVSAMLIMPLAACGSSSGDASGSKKYTIALISKGSNQSYWVAVHNGADAAAKKYGVSITYNAPDTETQVDKQVEIAQTQVNKSPDAVAISPLDEDAMVPVLQSAQSANIPIFAFDSGFKQNADKIISTVATSNLKVGEIAAENVARLYNGKGKYAVISHSETAETAIERRDGFLNYMKKNVPGMQMAGSVQYSNSDPAVAQNEASAIIQANPDIDVIYVTNEATVVGAAPSVEVAQKAGSKVVLVGVDSGKAQRQYIDKGVIAGSVSQDPYSIGYDTVRVAVEHLEGKKVSKSVNPECFWYDAKNQHDAKYQKALYE
jgi:ribose transport system substrate-binding protein